MGYGADIQYGHGRYKGVTNTSSGAYGLSNSMPNRIDKYTGICLRLSLKEHQGFGWTQYTGDEWLWPEKNAKPMVIYDNNDQPRPIVLDEITGKWYERRIRRGPDGSGITKNYLDKEDDYTGTEIPTKIRFPEHKAETEHYSLIHDENHFMFRPEEEANKGVTGYNANGLRTAQEVTAKIYKDGDLTEETKTKDIPVDGDITFDKHVEGHRLQIGIDTASSEYKIVGQRPYYIVKDKAASPNKRLMKETDYQMELENAVLYLSRQNPLVNVYDGTLYTGNYAGIMTGPDGYNSALLFGNNHGITIDSLSIPSGDFTLSFWINNIVNATTIISGAFSVIVDKSVLRFVDNQNAQNSFNSDIEYDGNGWVLIQVIRSNNNIIVYRDNAQMNIFLLNSNEIYSGGWRIMQDQSGAVFECPRVYLSALSANARTYYYDDIIKNNGNKVCPLM